MRKRKNPRKAVKSAIILLQINQLNKIKSNEKVN
jgi:hypothetical protein